MQTLSLGSYFSTCPALVLGCHFATAQVLDKQGVQIKVYKPLSPRRCLHVKPDLLCMHVLTLRCGIHTESTPLDLHATYHGCTCHHAAGKVETCRCNFTFVAKKLTYTTADRQSNKVNNALTSAFSIDSDFCLAFEFLTYAPESH